MITNLTNSLSVSLNVPESIINEILRINIPKVIISRVFKVSRSAVTQTSKKKESVQKDLICRIYKSLKSTSCIYETSAVFASRMSLVLLRNLRDEIQQDSNIVKIGRPVKKINTSVFSALKKLIRIIVQRLSTVCNSISDIVNPVQSVQSVQNVNITEGVNADYIPNTD